MPAKPIIFHDWQRHWYRVLDVVQPPWTRFRTSSAVGRVVIWLVIALAWLVWKLAIWTVIIGVGVSFVLMSWLSGSSKLLNVKTKSSGRGT